ncbi:MAG: hypothetical protein S4CHLAM2_08360 [Chlamydiales bacterium]|nr:hypothetical protein [Chlamydiales bacterium]
MKILIIKTSALGDLIHVFPTLGYLREKYPEAQIDWVVEERFAELICAHPQVDRVFMINSKKWRKSPWRSRSALGPVRETCYDVAFDLQGNIKSSVVLRQIRAKKKVGFGWKTVSEWPNALFTGQKFNPPPGQNIRDDYLSIVQQYFGDAKPYVFQPVTLNLCDEERKQVDGVLSGATLVCCGSAWENKQLSYPQLLALLKRLDCGPYLFAWGTEEERMKAAKLASHFATSVVLERCSLPVLQHVMARCSRVIAMDSLPLHLAATTQTPTLSFFGPSLAKKYMPPGEGHTAIQGECPYGVTFKKSCPQLRTCPSGACLKRMAIPRGAFHIQARLSEGASKIVSGELREVEIGDNTCS